MPRYWNEEVSAWLDLYPRTESADFPVRVATYMAATVARHVAIAASMTDRVAHVPTLLAAAIDLAHAVQQRAPRMFHVKHPLRL